MRLGLQRVRDAVASIDPVFLNTPQFESVPLSDALGCSVTLKVETLNPVRSFKIDRTRSLGAIVHLEGNDIEMPRVLARARADNESSYLVEDSLDLATCEGAATIGLEIVANHPDVWLTTSDDIAEHYAGSLTPAV